MAIALGSISPSAGTIPKVVSWGLGFFSYTKTVDFCDTMASISPSPSSAVPPSSAYWVEVLVDCPQVQGLFTYGVPAGEQIDPGDVIQVPFGAQELGAIAIKILPTFPPQLDPQQIKSVLGIVAKGFFSPHYWQLLDQVAQYYKTDPMVVIRTALPAGILQRSQSRIQLNTAVIPEDASFFLSHGGQRVLALLQQQRHGDYSEKYLRQKIKGAQRGIRELVAKGWAKKYLQTQRPSQPQWQLAAIAVASLGLPEDYPQLTPRQWEVWQILHHQGGELWLRDLLQLARTTRSVITRLETAGLVVVQPQEKLRLGDRLDTSRDQPKALTPQQQKALDFIHQCRQDLQYSLDLPSRSHHEILLHGVTGSGKTEVYLQAIAPVLAEKKSALVLVPEIGLTPQLTDRFRARFGDRVLVYHSELSRGERFDTWRRTLEGDPLVLIGTRSAIFAPLPQLGLIILDEEHDDSYKQTQTPPTYHARTLARWRSQLAPCPLILGSATPALETWHQCQNPAPNSPYHYLSLPDRIHNRPLPPVEIVDLRQELRQGNRSLFSQALQQRFHQLKEEQTQGILFISRRGHSTFVSCRSCGYVLDCPHCDVSLSYHYHRRGSRELLRCHYCNHTQTQPGQCPSCQSPYFKFFGTGTQKVMQVLGEDFPELSAIRFDSDTTTPKGSQRALLEQFRAGKADLLVGTQMLTKGLDLDRVTLVGVIAADGLLFQADYRAAERAFQVLTQVAGRAGRGEKPGEVIIQTYNPAHPVLGAVKHHDYGKFLRQELPHRRELNYPPYGALVLLRWSGLDEKTVQQTAIASTEWLQEHLNPEIELLGPAPAMISRISSRYRWHLVLKFAPENRSALTPLNLLSDRCPRGVHLRIDVDPLSFEYL